jgi:hypothetical protein
MFSSMHSLTSALDGGKWSASRPSRFTSRERAPGIHWIGSWVGPRAGLDALVERNIPSPCRGSNPRWSSPYPSAIPLSYHGSWIVDFKARLFVFITSNADVSHTFVISLCLFTNWLQHPSGEANSCSADDEITGLFFLEHEGSLPYSQEPPLDSVLSQTKPVYVATSYFFIINYNITLPSVTRSPSFGLSD